MRKWKVVALMLVVGLALAPISAAQSNGDLKQEVEQLRRDLQKVLQNQAKLSAENDALRAKVDATGNGESTLEEKINALADSLDYRAGTVESKANAIRVSGEFTTRNGWVSDRNFGHNDNDANDGGFGHGRFLVRMDFDFDRDVTTRFAIQSYGLFDNGNTPGGGQLDSVELHEAWIEFRNVFGRKELSSRTGRQEIVLGNEFIFGDNDFFAGETFDGTHMTWENDNFALHAIILKLQVNGSDNVQDWPYNQPFTDNYESDELYSLYFTLKTITNHELDLYWVYLNGDVGGTGGTAGNALGSLSTGQILKDKSGDRFFFHTIGARIGGEFPDIAAGLDWNVEFAYQFGDLHNGADVDVDGFALEAEIGITFGSEANFRIFARFLWAEGADEDGSDTGFIPLFPERHAHADHMYPSPEGSGGGKMNYRARYGIMNIIPMTNVITVQVGFTWDINPEWTLGFTALWATPDEEDLIAASGDDDIGWEFDLFVEYRYSDQTTVSAGVAIFLPEDAAPLKGGGYTGNEDDTAFLFYVQARVVF